jgi:hypothetical protein
MNENAINWDFLNDAKIIHSIFQKLAQDYLGDQALKNRYQNFNNKIIKPIFRVKVRILKEKHDE